MSQSIPARAGFAMLVMSVCVCIMAQDVPLFRGRVEKIGGTGLPHASVRIEGAGAVSAIEMGEEGHNSGTGSLLLQPGAELTDGGGQVGVLLHLLLQLLAGVEHGGAG